MPALSPRYPPSATPETVYFSLTVDRALSFTAQSLLRRECGNAVGEIALEPLDDHHVRLWVYVATAACGVALHVLILGLPAAEFGPIRAASKWSPPPAASSRHVPDKSGK